MFLFAPSSTVFGIDNTNDYLNDVKLGAGGDQNTTLAKQHVNTLGSFIQHDWKSEKINFSLGLRYDHYWVNDRESDAADLSSGVLVPRAGIVYKFLPEVRFRVGYAKGYRAPQIFNEDLHINLVNASRVQTFNSDDLNQETSNAFTSSLNSVFSLGNTLNDLLVEGFYTLLKNPFANEFYPLGDEGNFAYMRVNAEDGAFVSGVNLEWKSFVTDHLETQLGFTFQANRYETAQAWGEKETSVSKNFMRTPNRYGYASFIWTPAHRFNTSVSLNYTGPMDVPHFGLNPDDYEGNEKQAVQNAIARGDIIEGEELIKADGFIVADILFSYDIHFGNETELQFYAGVKNIFNQIQKDYDRGAYRDAGYIYGPSLPRTINFGIKFGNIL
ncbi:MAG: TonB-dependent receptor plug domain-containing protein [Bacteroidota bacterium]